jgi:hypothetical protein
MRDYGTKIPISTTADIRNVATDFDVCGEAPVFWSDDRTQTDEYKAIVNETRGELAMIASDSYAIIQHQDVLNAIHDELRHKNIDVSGTIRNMGNVFCADLIFGSKNAPVKDEATGIKVGMRVMNSYNRKTAFRIECFGFRAICSNGMVLGKVLYANEITFHSGREKSMEEIRKKVSDFIANSVSNSQTLQTYVNASMKDSIAWTELGKLLEKLFIDKKHRVAIAKKFGISIIEIEDKRTKKVKYEYVLETDGTKKINRWTLYNSMTEYATHNKFTLGVETKIQNAAQEVLRNKYEDLITVEVE